MNHTHDIMRDRLLRKAGVIKTTLKDRYRTEWSPRVEKLMRNRLVMGSFRYQTFEEKRGMVWDYDTAEEAIARIRRYQKDGNTEHLVDIDYIDGWNFPSTDTLIWEREFGTRILSKVSLPEVGSPNLQPDNPERFNAFVDAIRWSTSGKIAGLIDLPDEYMNYPITSPWKSAVQVEDYQLYPVLKAIALPRVSLLLADDVGVGKTIEAGLILSELIAQRGIRRIMIICPASIQEQWKEELK